MTRVCVTSTGPTLESFVDPRFGRCAYFVFVDTDTMAFDAVPNAAAMASGGAGIRAAQMISDRGVEVLITGSVGPNAYPALQSQGIRVMIFINGTVKDAVEQFLAGSLRETVAPGPAYAGAGRGASRGIRGMGGGMGHGRGRGRHGGGW